MKISIKHRISYGEADRLIERYYDGLTTVEEEKRLQRFLAQSGLPERYQPEQAIFGYFEKKKRKPVFRIQPYIRWASAAAAVVVVAFSVQRFTAGKSSDYAYVNGVKITNINEVKSQALASISDVTTDNNEVEKSFGNLNDNELMQQQLDVFSGLGE